MDRKYEYVGLDIRDKVHNEVFKYIFSIGNHYYNDYEDLKDLIKNLLDLGDNKDIELMINSITDLNLYPIEKRNYLASQGFNKRIFDYCSIICALKECGYDLSLLKDEEGKPLYWKSLTKMRGNLITKIQLGLDIMINNPTDFRYCDSEEDDASFNRKVESDSQISGIELCNLMNYLIHPNIKNIDIIKCGNYIETKKKVKAK